MKSLDNVQQNNLKTYQAEFVVLEGDRCMPIIESPTIHDLIKVQQHTTFSLLKALQSRKRH